MLPGPERLREIATAGEGSLSEVPYAVLLTAIATQKLNCVAVLKRRQTEKRIFFGGGVPQECLSNLLHETFGRYLVGQGLIAEEEFSRVFAQANVSGLRLGQVLVERGTFPKEEVARLLQANLVRKLLDGFSWNEGTYQLLPDPPPIDSPPHVDVAQLIVTGVSKFAQQQAVDAAVGALVGKRLAFHPSPQFPIESLQLTESQARLAAALEKRPRIDELAVSAGLPFEEISRVLYAFWLLGTVVTTDQVPHAATAPVSATRPKLAPTPKVVLLEPAGNPPPEAAPGKAREEMRRAYDTQRDLDAYELFDLADADDEATVRNRFLEKARTWAPWQFEGDSGDVERASTLFLAAARAYAVLADPKSRESLQRSRRVTGQELKRSPAQYFAIKTDVLDPETHHRKAVDLLSAGNPKQAVAHFEFAADCDPQNGSYAADLAWCRFLASNRMTPASTLAELEEAIRIDPKSGIACYYAGEILRARGELERAETYYRKAARLLAPDRRPLDALREMGRSSPR